MEEQELSRDQCYKLVTYFGDNATPQNRKFYNYFAATYNKIIEGGKTAVEAMASISQIKTDIAVERDKIFDLMKSIVNKFEVLGKGIGSENQDLFYYKTVVSQTAIYLLTGGTEVNDRNQFLANRQKLKEIITLLREKVEKPLLIDHGKAVDNLFDYKAELIFINAQYVGLTDTVNEIIRQGYPNNIKTYSTDEEYKKEKQLKRMGRPLDPEVPQEPIDKKVKELILKGKSRKPGFSNFWHYSGQYKGNPNKNQIANQLIEDDLVGELTKKQVTRRIDSVIESMDISR